LRHDKIFGAFGIHPHDSGDFTSETESEIRNIISNEKKIVAWGEIGLDYFKNHAPKQIQQKAFARQLECAVALKLPIVIHTRDAEADTFQILSEVVKDRGHRIHVHCFTSSLEFSQKLLGNYDNLFLGITGIVTFSNHLKEIVRKVNFMEISNDLQGSLIQTFAGNRWPIFGTTSLSVNFVEYSLNFQWEYLSLRDDSKNCRNDFQHQNGSTVTSI
jgi:TatD family hydrolase